MEKTLDAPEVRQRIDQALDEIAGNGRRTVYLVERDGEPFAAVVPIAIYEEWKRRRRAFGDRRRAAAARANLTPEDADRLVDDAIRAVRGRS